MTYKTTDQRPIFNMRPGDYPDEDRALLSTLHSKKAVIIPITRSKSSMKNRIYNIAKTRKCTAHIITAENNNELIVWLVPNKLVK